MQYLQLVYVLRRTNNNDNNNDLKRNLKKDIY